MFFAMWTWLIKRYLPANTNVVTSHEADGFHVTLTRDSRQVRLLEFADCPHCVQQDFLDLRKPTYQEPIKGACVFAPDSKKPINAGFGSIAVQNWSSVSGGRPGIDDAKKIRDWLLGKGLD